ncbi:MAG TPA: serine hydrolase domain-containing protein, partial [Chthoniobacteraceae bacterium]|nr:serine hydrolase domain-containing protein [Chthoniobacteraceae bacterium]
LLQQDGKLKLDDPVERYVPNLTRGDSITIRQVLSHTSGYEDYWPQDYVFPAMLKPTTPEAILDQWARKPLDFEPGTDWQYSNTNYTIAGLIVEKVSGMKLMDFLQKRIFTPLHMTVGELGTAPAGSTDAIAYTRVALGPLHPAPVIAPGWLFAMGELEMTPRELALWDISMIDRSLLAPESYDAMTTPVALRSGRDSHYGLGVELAGDGARKEISHEGEISGLITENEIWPELKAAVVVIVNADGATEPSAIADRIAKIILPPDNQPPKPATSTPQKTPPPENTAGVGSAREFFSQLRQGKVDASKLTANAASFFTPEALQDAATGLKPLGELQAFVPLGPSFDRGGFIFRAYFAKCGNGRVFVNTCTLKDGRFEQFLVLPFVM